MKSTRSVGRRSKFSSATRESALRKWVVWGVTACALIGCVPTSVLAWDPFRTENDNVSTGNARMAAGDHAGALAAYDLAAREHPEEPRVQLNRGLALMAAEDYPAAREALVAGADPDAPAEIRAAAYYNLGLSFYREGDAAAAEEDHRGAQAHFREAADALRRSLRIQPGNRDAGWNLELALRRIREEQEAQEEQERQEQENQENQENQDQDGQEQQGDGQDSDQQNQEGQDSDQQNQDGQDGQDQQNQDGQDQQDGQNGENDADQQSDGQDGQDQDGQDGQGEQGEDGQEQNSGEDGQDGSEQEGEEPQGQDASGEQQGDEQDGGEGGSSGSEERESEEGEGEGQGLPGHATRVLDALQDNERSLEAARARARAARGGRRVLRDW